MGPLRLRTIDYNALTSMAQEGINPFKGVSTDTIVVEFGF